MAKDVYTLEEIVDAALRVLRGNRGAAMAGEVSVEAASGAASGVLALMMTLGIGVRFSDGTKWDSPQDAIDAHAGHDHVRAPALKTDEEKEKMN